MEKNGAEFSPCGKYRLSLWRIWDLSKPLVMFVGLNPSTANETDNDPTIKSVIRISKHNGYGGFYMMNCWAYISTDPKQLKYQDEEYYRKNIERLEAIGLLCNDVVFAWGNFKVVKDNYMDVTLSKMFPDAKVIGLNKNGSPKHPLYQKSTSTLNMLYTPPQSGKN